jgi:hypothetical protein
MPVLVPVTIANLILGQYKFSKFMLKAKRTTFRPPSYKTVLLIMRNCTHSLRMFYNLEYKYIVLVLTQPGYLRGVSIKEVSTACDWPLLSWLGTRGI